MPIRASSESSHSSTAGRDQRRVGSPEELEPGAQRCGERAKTEHEADLRDAAADEAAERELGLARVARRERDRERRHQRASAVEASPTPNEDAPLRSASPPMPRARLSAPSISRTTPKTKLPTCASMSALLPLGSAAR